MTKTRRSSEQWQQLINEQPNSGLSIKQYCQQEQITVSGFYLWRKKLCQPQFENTITDWLSLPSGTSTPPTDNWQYELTLPGGVVLRIKQPS